MRNAIVNAAVCALGGADETPTALDPALVEPKCGFRNRSPRNSNNNGGTLGRAMSGAGDRRGIARAGDFQAIVGCLAIIALAGCTPAFTAPDIWPQLFGQ